jgi:thiamine pyrophosphate-dependent acetolactate synthase large subunit-like protein
MSRLGAVQELLEQSDLLISVGARLTEFDTGRFSLKFPPTHIRIVDSPAYPGTRFPASLTLAGDIATITASLAPSGDEPRPCWFDIAAAAAREESRLEALNSDAYRAIRLLRRALDRHDVVVNDQSILNYWASAFFPVFEPRTFLYPAGSGTLGYGLPAAIGSALAARQQGSNHRIICVAGDGGFQYTLPELATLKQYDLPVKVLLVNDEAYGVIGFLQRSVFGQTHEVNLKNPDFRALAESYGISATRATSLAELSHTVPAWLDAPGPALLEWRTTLQAPWEVGAIPRPANTTTKEPD